MTTCTHSITDTFKGWIAVSGDLGSFQAIQAISNFVSCRQLSLISDGIHSTNYWIDFFINEKISGIFCGTSKSKSGFVFEKNIRIAACKLNLPIVCIEDFFGNYTEIIGIDTSLLVVEDNFFMKSYKTKINKMLPMLVCPSIRYDHLREGLLNTLIKEKNSIYPKRALWIGQPESNFNFLTLKHIAPRLKTLSVTLLFRAHPRDNLYESGFYQRYFDSIGLSWVDITRRAPNKFIFNGVSLVITQFSSLAIEAGFYGIPTLNILLKKAGRKLLLKNTGFSELICTHYNAAFLMDDNSPLNFLDSCFTNIERRNEVLCNFNKLYKVNEKQIFGLMLKIQDIISINVNKDL